MDSASASGRAADAETLSLVIVCSMPVPLAKSKGQLHQSLTTQGREGYGRWLHAVLRLYNNPLCLYRFRKSARLWRKPFRYLTDQLDVSYGLLLSCCMLPPSCRLLAMYSSGCHGGSTSLCPAHPVAPSLQLAYSWDADFIVFIVHCRLSEKWCRQLPNAR